PCFCRKVNLVSSIMDYDPLGLCHLGIISRDIGAFSGTGQKGESSWTATEKRRRDICEIAYTACVWCCGTEHGDPINTDSSKQFCVSYCVEAKKMCMSTFVKTGSLKVPLEFHALGTNQCAVDYFNLEDEE
ncbi:hypothetical protein KAU33_06490, partial [Candidatus Dependentiae bacterium]|nr:hypothetical protein [Candidatus Dependentiae bacterium]